jgi:hypothetical protein
MDRSSVVSVVGRRRLVSVRYSTACVGENVCLAIGENKATLISIGSDTCVGASVCRAMGRGQPGSIII